MFCTSLRSRKEWVTVPPTLLSQQQPRWQEQDLQNHDLAISLLQTRQQDQEEVFRLLLLSPADIQPTEKSFARIDRLYQAGGKHVGIVFLLHEKVSQDGGTRAFMSLQATLVSNAIQMPVILLSNVSSLIPTVSAIHRQLFQSTPVPPQINPATTLLPYCSNNPPIPEHARNVLSDICHSIPELAQAAMTPEGQKELQRWLTTEPSPTVADDVIGFWEQEYIAE